jgi:glyoxylase-like metal-dependent hydrolase (beta-lactamase superfamily II)
MKIVEFGDDGKPIERERIKIMEFGLAEPAAPVRATPEPVPSRERKPSDIQLYMFQTGVLRTKVKYIKMNQGEESYDIPVPWFLIKHPKGNVIIDGGNAVEAAIDKRGYWGDVVDAYDPLMDPSESCVEQARSVGVEPDDVRYVLQSHLHLDHTGAVGRFPRATHIVQRIEYEYAHNPDWFSKGAYIRADFDRPGIDWKFLGGEYTDDYDLFGDGSIRMIFTPGHSPGHQSFLVTLPNTGPVLLTIDAAYTIDHWNDLALPGLVCSSVDAARSVHKLRKIAKDTGAMVVTGHDPDNWKVFQKGPREFYD